MAVKHLGDGIYKGLSGDTKPTAPITTAVFIETDTRRVFIYDGAAWTSALGTITMNDAANIILNTTTGTKIGTATTQKLSFFNATPVIQRSAITSPDETGAQLKIAVDAIRQVLIDLGLTA